MNPKYITIHCSATQNSPSVDAARITKWHLNRRGFNDIGYHFVITTDGEVEVGRSLSFQGAHVKGHNEDNIGICLVGGVDSSGKSVMNFNDDQLESLKDLVFKLKQAFSISDENIKGHREWSPDLDGDGKVETNEWLKDCPCFDVQHWLKTDEAVFKI